MEIKQLRSFIAAADTLNFSRAAESLYLSQPALSRQIMELEQEIGTPLFIRSTRSVQLTDAGRMLQVRAKELISDWEKLVPEVRRRADMKAGSLSLIIGTDPRALAEPERRMRFLNLLYRMRREYRGIRILLQQRSYQTISKELGEGNMDCALLLDRELALRPGLKQLPLGGEEMVLVFRSRNLHSDEEYARVIMSRGLILVDQEPQGLYHIIHILNDLRLEPQIRFCGSLQDMTMTVETGESAMILPRSVFDKLANPQLQCLRLPSRYAALNLSMVYPEGSENPMLPVLLEQTEKEFL